MSQIVKPTRRPNRKDILFWKKMHSIEINYEIHFLHPTFFKDILLRLMYFILEKTHTTQYHYESKKKKQCENKES